MLWVCSCVVQQTSGHSQPRPASIRGLRLRLRALSAAFALRIVMARSTLALRVSAAGDSMTLFLPLGGRLVKRKESTNLHESARMARRQGRRKGVTVQVGFTTKPPRTPRRPGRLNSGNGHRGEWAGLPDGADGPRNKGGRSEARPWVRVCPLYARESGGGVCGRVSV